MDLVTPWYAYKTGQYRQHPVNSNRASSLGGDCVRELVYWRTRASEAQLPERDVRILLQEGEKHEREVLMELQRAGVRVLEQQRTLEWKEHQITGHVDAVIVDDESGVGVPVDVKSMSEHIWGNIFFRGPEVYDWEQVAGAFQKKPWLRKYLAQITLYMLMRSSERGMFLCINKSTGALAQVNIRLDYAYGEELLQRAAVINEHVARGTIPDRIPFHEEVCPRCAFYSICLPDHIGKPAIAFLENSKVEELLEVRLKHQDARDAWEEADERAKGWAKARPETRLTVGRFLLQKKPHGKGTRVDIEAIA